MLEPQHVTFDELSERLRAYEQKYGYSTIQFYRRYRDGDLGDDDDLMLWAGLYHIYLTIQGSSPFRTTSTSARRIALPPQINRT